MDVSGAGRARLEATVVGRVQGVGFRYHVLDVATQLDLDGWVANAEDGSVRCVAEGTQASLVAFETALRTGPSGARVDAVHVMWTGPVGIAGGFRIRSLGHAGD